MVLRRLPPTQEPWSRWPHPQPQPQHAGADYNMIPTSVVSYDCRTAEAPSYSKSEMGQQFLPVSFSQPPIPSTVQSHFPAPMSYGEYNTYNQSPVMAAPFKTQEFFDRAPQHLLPAQPVIGGALQERAIESPQTKRSDSPSVKSEAKSILSAPPSPIADASTTPPLQEGVLHQFDTPIDNVVRVIEAKLNLIEPTDESKLANEDKDGQHAQSKAQTTRARTKRRRFRCEFQGCNKMCSSKNNLITHRRAHTGERPYICPYCLDGFSQSANLSWHINRHIGEKPYKCGKCPKTFAQPSTASAHEHTHEPKEKRAIWICKFPNCKNKPFTAKGNLKQHQNNFHGEEIKAFHAKLAAIEDKSMLSKEDKEMAKYLAEVHNLANKGIKGRGKGRKVKRVAILHPVHRQQQQQQLMTPSPSMSPSTTASTPIHQSAYPVSPVPHGLPQAHHYQQTTPAQQQQQLIAHHQHHENYHGLPYYGLSSPAAYSMSRPPNAIVIGNGGIIDSDGLSDASSVGAATPVMHAYGVEHVRAGFW